MNIQQLANALRADPTPEVIGEAAEVLDILGSLLAYQAEIQSQYLGDGMLLSAETLVERLADLELSEAFHESVMGSLRGFRDDIVTATVRRVSEELAGGG